MDLHGFLPCTAWFFHEPLHYGPGPGRGPVEAWVVGSRLSRYSLVSRVG